MADDDKRSYAQQLQDRSISITGAESSPDEVAARFVAQHDFNRRVEILEDVNRNEAARANEPLSVRQAAERRKELRIYAAMRDAHERARKAGR
jgi:hypothetical protein